MTQYTRRVFFYSSIALFALLSPILIAYSIGYTFRLHTGLLEKTGGIFIKSKTPRMSIFLDGTFMKQTSYLSGGALLTNIAPGIHHLRLEKVNHHPWSTTIHVKPMLVTDFRNIVLISEPIPIATSTPDELNAIRSPSANIPAPRPVAQDEIISLLDVSAPAVFSAFFLDTKGNLTGKTATTTKIIASYVHSFNVVDKTLYFININGFLGKFDPVSQDITTIGRPGFYLLDKPAQFSQAPDGNIVVLDASGGLFLSDGATDIKTITGGVRQFAFDSSGAKMLIRKDQSIDILWLEDNVFQPFEKMGTRNEVFASDTPIQDADWFFADNAHIIIRTTDGIFFTDIDARNGKNIVQLFFKKTDELITAPSLPASIFFRKENIFYTISI